MPKIIPLKDNILVKRKIIGEKSGSLYMPDEVKERNTDLAEVVYVPDLTFTDKALIDNAERIVGAMTDKIIETGDRDSLDSLMNFNDFIKRKSLKVGDKVFISKYVGTDFHETGKNDNLTLVRIDDIIGFVVEDEKEKDK